MHSETRPSCVCDLVEIHAVVLFCLTFVAIWFTHTSTKKQKKFCVTGNFGPGQYVNHVGQFGWRDVKCSSEGKGSQKTDRQGRSEGKGPPSFWKGPIPSCPGRALLWPEGHHFQALIGDRQLPTWSLVLFRTILVLFPWRIYKPNLFLRLMLLKDLT